MDELLAIRIEKELKDKLQKLADKNRRSLSDYCRLILEQAEKENKQI